MVGAVIFDVDGVLVYPWQFRSTLWRDHGISSDMTSSFFRGCFVDCLEGRADLLEVLPPFLKEWRWSGSAGDFVDTWLTVENAPNPEVLSVVAEVRRLGIPCYVASTQERHRAGYLAKEMRLREMFDGLFFSSDLGVCKPNENFFRAIAGRLGRPTGELLFFDDSPEKCTSRYRGRLAVRAIHDARKTSK